jgi:hypothetical protein
VVEKIIKLKAGDATITVRKQLESCLCPFTHLNPASGFLTDLKYWLPVGFSR